MKPLIRGLVIAAVQVGLVASLGAKMLYDRAVQPRLWVQTMPYDPNLPIRGRYVRLVIMVEPRGIKGSLSGENRYTTYPVVLRVEGGKLVAEATEDQGYESSDVHVIFLERAGKAQAVLSKSLAFFIPEHLADPSNRPPGEELWVEVTLPKQGPPRPIRLGVKKGDGPIVPLEIN